MDVLPKALKTTHAASARSHRRCRGMHDVLHLEMVLQRVLAVLPLADLESFLSAYGSKSELAWMMRDAPLWEELSQQHFVGPRVIPAEAQADEREVGDNGFDAFPGFGDDSDDDDDDDSEGEDEVDDASQHDDAREESVITDGNAAPRDHDNNDSSVSSETTASTTTADTVVEAEAESSSSALPLNLNLVLPSWLNAETACDAAREFFVSMNEWLQFQQRVLVVRGDLGTIQEIDGHAIDAIAFPGNAMMRNPYNGAAGVVFTRAGSQLDEHTSELSISLRAGQCHVTPGFDTGARVLIHCHGPYNSHPRLFPTLAKTYRNALRAAKQENAECVALASISTGNFGVPIPEAAQTAMQAIQHYLRAHHEWQGRVGIVCYEADVYEAFASERQRVLEAFNVHRPVQ